MSAQEQKVFLCWLPRQPCPAAPMALNSWSEQSSCIRGGILLLAHARPAPAILGSSTAHLLIFVIEIYLQSVLTLTLIRIHITYKADNQTPWEWPALLSLLGAEASGAGKQCSLDAMGILLCCVTFSKTVTLSGPLLYHLWCLSHEISGIKGYGHWGMEALSVG